MGDRNLTDDDAKVIADLIWEKAQEKFFLNVGMGFIGLVWKGVMLVLLLLAAYGVGKQGLG